MVGAVLSLVYLVVFRLIEAGLQLWTLVGFALIAAPLVNDLKFETLFVVWPLASSGIAGFFAHL
jgi:hypothetical protein